ncbi:type IV secretory system conjugative DNA transfer family protein [Enterococcus hirae]
MKRKKEVSKSQKKNYQKGKQNPLRFLSNKKLLISGSIIAYFCLLVLEVWLVENFFALTSQSLWDFEVISLWKIRIIHSIFSNLLLYMILSVIDIAVLAKVSYQLYTSFRPLEEDLVQGTMQFETVENMDKQYELVPVHMNTDKDDFFDGKPGYPVGRKPQTEEDKRLNRFYYYVDTSDSDSITLAGTRQGKGIYFVDPFIDILTRARLIANRASFVMTATKGDEPRKWYKTLKRRGYRIRVANTVNQFYSDPMPVLGVFNHYFKHYKRLREESIQEKEKGHEDQALNLSIQAEKQLANAEKMISQIAHMYFKEVNKGKDGGFWTKACRNLFKSVGMALADQEYDRGETLKVNPYTIYTVVNEMQKRRIKEKSHDFLKKYATSEEHLAKLLADYDGKSELDVFFGELPREHPAARFYDAIMASAPAHVTLGNIITHFDGDLEPFIMSANAKMTAFDDGFDMELIGFDREQPTAVFIVMSDADSSNNDLGVMYLDQIYQVLLNRCNLETSSQCYRDVHFILEEGGNLGVPIRDLSRKWTSGLSRHLFLHLVLQDLQQLSMLYSEDTKDTIIGSTGILTYIRTASDKTNQYIAGRLGKRSNYSKTRHRSPLSIESTETESSERIDLMASFELERTQIGESIILRGNKHTDLQGKPIYQYPIYNTRQNDTHMIPFYEFRKMEKVSWDEIPVNNEFMAVELRDLAWSLEPEEIQEYQAEEEKIIPDIPVYQKPKRREETPMAIQSIKDLGTQEQKELNMKEKKARALEKIYHAEIRKRSISEVFSKDQIRKIRQLVKGSLFNVPEAFNEFNQIVAEGTLDSLFSFLVSNGDEKLLNLCIQQFKEWQGGHL